MARARLSGWSRFLLMKSWAPAFTAADATVSSSRPVRTMIGMASAPARARWNVSRPTESGRERSIRAASTSWSASRTSPSARVWTTSTRNRVAVDSASASLMSLASPGLSSISSTRTIGSSITAGSLRQLHDGQPEVLDRLDHGNQLLDIQRLGDVAVGVEVVSAGDVCLCLGGGQDDDGNPTEIHVPLDLRQDFAAVLARHVEVEQDEIGPGGAGERILSPEVGERLDAVGHDVQPVADLRLRQRLLHEPRVASIVLNEEDVDGLSNDLHAASCWAPIAGSVNLNVDPCPGSDSTQIRPPCCSTIFLQMANPIPVPGYSSRLWSRWKIRKIRSRYFASMPTPLSCTENTHSRPWGSAATRISGRRSLQNLRAFPIRFWKS